jgi:hypothetical protein
VGQPQEDAKCRRVDDGHSGEVEHDLDLGRVVPLDDLRAQARRSGEIELILEDRHRGRPGGER